MNKHQVYMAAFGVLGVLALIMAIWYALLLMQNRGDTMPAAAAVPQAQPPFVATSTLPASILSRPVFQYIEVVDSCDWAYVGSCVNMRSGPGVAYPVVARLRTGVVLKVADAITREGSDWHKILFDGELRYPERVSGNWYVAAEYVRLFTDEGDRIPPAKTAILNDKRIAIDVSEQMLYAYEDDALFMQEPISTGKEFTPTPRGTFIVYKKTPSRYMQGPIEGVSDQYYDLPGVPWDLYFTHGGAVIHGAYWHENFGEPWSHGCVNLPSQKAKQLYLWTPAGTPVTVRD